MLPGFQQKPTSSRTGRVVVPLGSVPEPSGTTMSAAMRIPNSLFIPFPPAGSLKGR